MPQSIIAREFRPVLVASAVLALAALVCLSVEAAGRSGPMWPDNIIGHPVYALLGPHRSLVRAAVVVAGPLPVTAVTIVFALVMLAARPLNRALLVVTAPALTSALTEFLLKPVVHRTLGGGLCFPSGHATGIYALAFLVVALVCDRQTRVPRAVRWTIAIAAVAVGALIGLSQFVAGNHYPSDTVAAGLLALVVVVSVSLVLDLVDSKR